MTLLVLLLLSAGPHGGEVKAAKGAIDGHSIELVVTTQNGVTELHAYGVHADVMMDLERSGYGGMTFRLGELELPLDVLKRDGHYIVRAKLPRDPKMEIEVTIAFPSKRGTGVALFRPFAER